MSDCVTAAPRGFVVLCLALAAAPPACTLGTARDVPGSGGGGSAGQGGGGSGGSVVDAGGDAAAGTDAAAGDGAAGWPAIERVGFWRFDEGMGTTALDSSGKGNHGRIVEGTTRSARLQTTPAWVVGADGQGKALVFDGRDDWVDVPQSAALDRIGASGFSLMAWVRVTGYAPADGFNFIVSRHVTGTAYEDYGLGLRGGAPTCAIQFTFVTAPAPVPLNRWVHLAITYDGFDCRVYQDGQQVAGRSVGLPITPDDTQLVIGANQNLQIVKEFHQGAIDEVKLFSGALRADEVRREMGAP